MTFSQSINTCLKEKYCDFNGRASLSEFWWFWLFTFIVSFAVGFITMPIFAITGSTTIGNIISWAVNLALLLPSLGVAVRRLHDIGKSGWYLLLCLIPIVGWIILIIWDVKVSQIGENQYGPQPIN